MRGPHGEPQLGWRIDTGMIGIDAGLPFCMNDELCARLFPDGKPDLLRIEQIRKVPQ